MGSKKKPTQQVADYMMSMHFGVCHEVDSIERIKINDKVIFEGRQSGNGTLSINLPNLFGGNKKEGGARGLIEVLMGAADQLLPTGLAAKLGGTPSSVPGFRGVTSLFFTGGGAQPSEGFYWTSNSPYLRPVDVTVKRSPKGFYPEKAMVPDTGIPGSSLDLTWSRRVGFTQPHDNSSFAPRVRKLSNDGAEFYVPSWGNSYPNVASLTRVLVTPGSVTSTDITVTGGTGVPPQGLTDEVGHVLKKSGQVLSDETGAGLATPGGSFQIRFGKAVGIGGGTLRIGHAPTIDGVAHPSYATAPVSGNRAMALSVDRLYLVNTTSVDVYDHQLNLLDSFPTTLSGAQAGYGHAWVDGDNLYTLSASEWLLRKISISKRQLVDQVSVPPRAIQYYSFGMSVDKGVLVLAHPVDTGFGQGDLVVESYKWTYDHSNANPAHIIYECLTNTDWGLGLSTSQIDIASFTAAADTLYDEALGLSMLWSNPSDLESFINDILGHIDGSYGIDPATGKIYLSLVRGGYSTVGLFELTPDNCTVTRFQRKSLSETVNEVVVTWTNPENEQEETVTVHDLANYSMQGVLNSASSNYYGVRNPTLATRLALRDLTRGAAPLASFEIDADRSAWKGKPGEVVLLTYPEYGLVDLPLRIMSVNYGRPGASKVKLSLVEDVFDTPDSAYVEISSSLDNNVVSPPVPVEYVQGGSVPYYLIAQELGSSEASSTDSTEAYALILASSESQLSSIELQMASTNALGTTEYVSEGSLTVSGRATLSAGMVLEPTSQMGLTGFTGNIAPSVGGLVWIGSGDPKTSELGLISALGTTLSVIRGVLDTTPKVWSAGTPVWFIEPGVDVYDATAHLNGQTVSYKLIPTGVGGTLDPEWVTSTPVTVDNRQHLPYRPANVKLGGASWPATVEGPVVVTWSRRNRLLEDPAIRAWTDADVAPESGTTYTASLYKAVTYEPLLETSGITGTSVTLDSTYSGEVYIELKAVRDGMASYQSFNHTFTLVIARKTETGQTRISESGETRILEI